MRGWARPAQPALTRSPQVQRVVNRHRQMLLKIFRYYSRTDSGGGGGGAIAVETLQLINWKEFVKFLRDTELLDEELTQLVARLVFANSQQDGKGGEGGKKGGKKGKRKGGDTEMDYGEFVESLCAIMTYKIKNPMLPFDHRCAP